jgi:hypothetical protein
MSLQDWEANGWLRTHKTSPEEIANLFAIVDRDLIDSSEGISPDWRFGIAYNAALKLCTILLYASGYRAERQLQHYRTIQALPIILGVDRKEDAEYLDTCRKKRNVLEYDYAGGATDANADELISFVKDLREDVHTWLTEHHPDLIQTSQH